MIHPALSLATTGATEAAAFLNRLSSRKGLFARARARARETKKPLVVVGAPSGGIVTGKLCQYECGDLPCVDLGGCKECGAAPRDLTKRGAIPAGDGGAIVFVSYVLEYVDDIDAAFAEVGRASGVTVGAKGALSGSTENLFVARLQNWSSLAKLATGARFIVDEAPPEHGRFLYHRTTRPPRDISHAKRRLFP